MKVSELLNKDMNTLYSIYERELNRKNSLDRLFNKCSINDDFVEIFNDVGEGWEIYDSCSVRITEGAQIPDIAYCGKRGKVYQSQNAIPCVLNLEGACINNLRLINSYKINNTLMTYGSIVRLDIPAETESVYIRGAISVINVNDPIDNDVYNLITLINLAAKINEDKTIVSLGKNTAITSEADLDCNPYAKIRIDEGSEIANKLGMHCNNGASVFRDSINLYSIHNGNIKVVEYDKEQFSKRDRSADELIIKEINRKYGDETVCRILQRG